MKSQIRYMFFLRGQQIFFLILSLFAFTISAYYTVQEQSVSGLTHLLDLIPMLVGCGGASAIAGIYSEGSFNYHLLRYPKRIQVMAHSVVAYGIFSLVSLMLLFGVCAFESVIISLYYGYQLDYSLLFYSAIKFIILVFLFSILGSALGFLGKSVALSLFTYVGIVWLLPIIVVFLGVFKKGLSEVVTQYLVSWLAVKIMNGNYVDGSLAVIEFGMWITLALLSGYLRFRGDK